jgi:tetratricopeptide (TPR) repeat protein/transcriptional regulator with XRE-family HTH domain
MGDGRVVGQGGPSFGGLLRRLRDDAGLTQDELAEAARVSQRAISDLERGINRTARKDTAVLLASALDLDGPARELFVSAARGRAAAGGALVAGDRPAGSSAAARTLPRDIAGFTGRDAELGRLVAALDDAASGGGVVGIHAIGGMAGIGKTTLAVHAAHRLAGRFPDGQMFLPLHAHTPGQRPVEPADALAGLLLAAGVAAQQIPAGLDARAGCWRDHLAGKKTLLVLDDAAGHEQVRPLLPGTAGSLVLITSRRRLAALEDAAVISLDTLPPGDAAALLARLSGRPELASAAGPAGEIARLCGYLPLAIGMLARQLCHHPAWTAAGLASDLAAARDRLELMHAENLSVAAAFGLSYRDLAGGQRRLFRALGLHPGPDIDAYAAAALTGTGVATARRHLEALYGQHLITEPGPGRYGLHDLVREHARAMTAADDPSARASATGRLLGYYAHTALAASKHIPDWITAQGRPAPGPPPACAPPIRGPQQAFAWLEAERVNLHAAAIYAASADLEHAVAIPAAMASFLNVRGYWDEAQTLHRIAVNAARQTGDMPAHARALALLAGVQGMAGNIPASAANTDLAMALYRDLGNLSGQADCLNGMGTLHGITGNYPAADAYRHQALALFRDLGDQRGQGDVLNELGALRWLAGDYAAAAAFHQQALELFRDIDHLSGQGDALINLGIVQRLTGNYTDAVITQRQALAIFHDLRNRYRHAFALNELGMLQRLAGDYPAAAATHQQAAEQFNDIGEISGEASARNELGLAQQLAGDYAAASTNCQRALALVRDIGDKYGQAEALNSLGELSRFASPQQAHDYHSQALAIARELGVPLEEARALEGIGRCHLQDGHPDEGTAHLQQALTIYQRIKAPAAQRVQKTLRDHRTRRDNLTPAPDR